MRNSILFILFAVVAVSCVSSSKYDAATNRIGSLLTQIDSLNHCVETNNQLISCLRDSISLLEYPADQRYSSAARMVADGDLEGAKKEIASLQLIFPKAKEYSMCTELLRTIEKKEAAIKAEQERLKALGFKVFKDNNLVRLDKITCSFSQFSFGRTFTFDYCPDVGEYSYDTADKNNTYILASLSLSTKENHAYPPSMTACKIIDGKLVSIGRFAHRYASWTSYGAKIGNYSDDSHDFSKVNSVRYKIAVEISSEDAKSPIVIVIPKEGKSYKNGLTPEEVNDNFVVVSIINRSKLK